ncbi:MAG: Mur ligase domain-containing protein, partial [Candidatus Nanopelagicales bacterium]|nr:Mur ligase domain-containing protein [Candidatus Nanopelagicales bacterium]
MQHPRPTPSPRSLGDLAALTGLRVVGDSTTVVTGITHDSRAIEPGDIFAALPGEHTDGMKFIAQARA